MPLLPLKSHVNTRQPAYMPYFSTGMLNASTISTGTLIADNISCNTLTTSTIDLDGQILTANPTELLLNGVPVATQSSLSTIADWALDPAISTVLMSGNNLLEASTISCITLVADYGLYANNLQAQNAIFQNLVAFNSIAISSFTSSISSVVEVAELGQFSTLRAGNASVSTTLDFTPDPSTIIFQDAQPSTFTIGQQINNLILNQIQLDAQQGILLGAGTGPDLIVSTNTVYVPGILSTPSLYVSSINGAEFTSTTLNIEFGSFSSIATQSISSIGAEIRQALMSSIVFSPSLNPSLGGVNVNLGLGNLLGNVVGWGAGVFGAVVGSIGLATGIAALTTGRQTQNITNNIFETVNGTTQLQFSTLGTSFSTIYRLNNSPDPTSIPGQEIFVSTIHPPGLAVRCISDPLYTPSTPSSTIQSFGQWVALPEANPSSISTVQDWALFPALSTVTFDNGVPAVIQSYNTATDNLALVGSNIQLVGNYTDAKNLLLVSTVSTAVVAGANPNVYAPTIIPGGSPGLKIDAANLFLSTPVVVHPGFFNGSTINANSGFTRQLVASTLTASTLETALISTNTLIGTAPGGQQFINLNSDNVAISSSQLYLGNTNVNVATLSPNTLNAQFVNVSQYISSPYIWNWGSISTTALSTGVGLIGSVNLPGLSTVNLATNAAAGAQSQPAGRLVISGNDLDLGQQDIWCQQIRLGAGNATNAQTEIIFYDAAAGQRGLQTALQDRTIRVVSTINANQGGYILDTGINPPFFSTINAGTSTALFAFFPSTINSTIGASTLSVIPNPIFVAAAASLSSQKVLAANTPLALDLGSATVNVGGFTLAASTLTVPVAGTYQLSPSIQFNTTSGGANQVDFWLTKNGVDVPDSASRVSVANNAEQIGTVVIYDTAAANDKYGIKIASGDANMSAGFFQSTVATPYTRPAIPSIILNAQRIA